MDQKTLFLVYTVEGTDCASGHTKHFEFVTDDETLAQAHVSKFENSWSQAGRYYRIPFKAKQSIAERRAILDSISPNE